MRMQTLFIDFCLSTQSETTKFSKNIIRICTTSKLCILFFSRRLSSEERVSHSVVEIFRGIKPPGAPNLADSHFPTTFLFNFPNTFFGSLQQLLRALEILTDFCVDLFRGTLF